VWNQFANKQKARGNSMEITILGFLLIVVAVVIFRHMLITSFKISYYEAKLSLKGDDISHVENIGLIGIWKL
jgi:hypothetical protein